jgi:uncharacterized protein (TIGR02302 family)
MTQDDPAHLLRRLGTRRLLARFAILFERVWPVLWPPLAVAGAFTLAALLELPQILPAWAHILLLVATALAILALLLRGLAAIRPPDDAQADRRLELASGLVHRPLSVLTDRPASRDEAASALWQAHVTHAAGQIRRLRIGMPRPGLAGRDPRALRIALLVALVAGLAIAGPDAPARLAAAVEPTLPRAPGPPPTELQAWITPPAYTRLAPVFLRADGGAVTVPAGSHFTASVTGGAGTPTLLLDGHSAPFNPLDQASFQADRDLTQGGRLTIRRDGRDLAAWDLTVLADQPPHVAWADKPGRAPASQQIRLPWQVSDDYGVTGLQAELRLDARPDAPPLVVVIPLPGGSPRSAHGASQQDLTANPWAGLPVTAILRGHDALNQAATSDSVGFELPERPFHNEIARALIAIRKSLTLHPDDRDEALAGLDALLTTPQAFGSDSGAFVNLGAIYYLLVFDKTSQAIAQAQDRLWQLALHMEEGQAEQTARDLEAARQAAREALDKAVRDPSEANRKALDERLKDLQAAIDRHLQALMEEARRNSDTTAPNPDAPQVSNRDLERMAEQAREAARDGRMEDAQQRMAELERMLDQLRSARAEHGPSKQRNAQRQRGNQQMGALQDMVGRQGGLLDHAEGRLDQTQHPRGNPPPTDPADASGERDADRRVQQALRRALGELMQQFGDLTGEIPPSLGEADQAMREAGKQLGAGQDQAAGDAERQAIEALQKGGREMAQSMAKQFGQGQPGEDGDPDEGGPEGGMGLSMQDGHGDRSGDGPLPGAPGRADSRGRDPLGRRYNQGTSEAGDVTVPEERERQRTEAIQEELRRRGAERERPQQELDYIDRLLKQF